ncbi:MFS transporter [Paraburkholderia unamae]|uniref:MFS transporter n=1 Tax=Paraburkholderia unamae TaxID=219649 RepID=UPI001CC46977|nr:MFS transporter [Paraburkholderia unamae]
MRPQPDNNPCAGTTRALKETAMFDWYRSGSAEERKTFWACYAGWALESYDLQMFSFLMPSLMVLWTLTKQQAGMLGTVALLATALGGWIAGILADRYGRVRILMFTILWFTFFGVLAGFATSFNQMLVARTMQGFGFGGEWAVGAALMAEVVHPERRGRALGFVQSGFSLGWSAAVLVSTAIIAWLPPDWAWRVVFWVGVIPSCAVIFIRRNVKESASFTKAARNTAPQASLLSVFKPQYARSIMLASLLVIGLQAACYAILIWIPSLMVERGLAAGSMIVSILVMAVGAFFGFVSTAHFADTAGRRPALISLSVLAWVVTVCYMLVPVNPLLMQVLGFWVGFAAIGMFAALGPFLSELFPTRVRTTCMGFVYNVGKSIGATAIVGVGWLSAHTGLAHAIGLFCLAAYAISTFAMLMLPETRGVSLDDIDAQLDDATDNAQAAQTSAAG